ncbi:MAG: hypothetical protein GY854_05755 [Deltaproteobacteria bacterium]|nr:hypothetical protein [Deltaproteobacteria bacterium]
MKTRETCTWFAIFMMSALVTIAFGCESSTSETGNLEDGGGNTDTNPAGDADGDGDGDSDGDGDGDSDGDGDGDSDGDGDGDSDSDADTDTGCVDDDSDGWCEQWDCSDTDSSFNPDAEDIPGNGLDEDCDGVTDGINDTGNGTDDETEAEMGPGTDNEYDPSDTNSDGVATDPAGWLILDTENLDLKNLWIANEGEGTVSKVDTELVEETGRYYVGMSTNPSPSRTSVDLIGDVFVGNRKIYDSAHASVTKIASDPERCVDRNGNGAIDTSTGGTDVFARSIGGSVPAVQSTDECVVWTRSWDATNVNNPNPLDGNCEWIRAVAASAETGDDFEVNGNVWIGCYLSKTVYKLDGNNGDIIVGYDTPDANSYGFALDGEGRLWIASKDSSVGVHWLDTNDGSMHFMEGVDPYGIAMNDEGQVWTASSWADDDDGKISRYTPSTTSPDLTGGDWDTLDVGDDVMGDSGMAFRGIAVDKYGYVWAIRTYVGINSEIYLIDPALFPDTASVLGPYDLDDSGNDPDEGCGVAIDFAGHVWGISRTGCPDGNTGCATRLWVDRDATTGYPTVDISKTVNVPVGNMPYSYSDMIGYHLRHFTTKEGWYRQTFEVCPGHSTKWNEIEWEANVPTDTSFVIRARTADHVDELPNSPWFTVVEVPSDTSPKALPSTLPQGHFIELEVRLYTKTNDDTPKVGAIKFDFDCTYPVT